MKRAFFSLCAGAVGCALVLQFPATAIAKSKETVIFRFNHMDGAKPGAGLIDVNGTLYGTTIWGPNCSLKSGGCGTVFSINPTTTSPETVLYSFCGQQSCTDGQSPEASLIVVNGTLYGTTAFGGTYGYGTVFAVDPTTDAETVLYSFCSQQNCTDGAVPYAGLIDVNGTLYGTTATGGANVSGTVFTLDLKTRSETVLYSFCAQQNCSDGTEPFSGLIDVKGTLYGTTCCGGAFGFGTVFAFDVKTGAEKVLHSFGSSGTDGTSPEASLGLIDVKGTLYGTTAFGGASNANCTSGCGTVFSLNPGTGFETVLYAFCSHPRLHQCRDGMSPVAGLIDVKGTLYGTTPLGGTYCCDLPGNGVLFALDPRTGAETVLDAFGSRRKNGANSEANLIDAAGTLYGTTAGGGDHDDGTVFALRP